MPGDPFQIHSLSTTPLRRAATAAARPLLSWLLRLRTYRTLYERTQSNRAEPFERRALEALDIRPRVSDEEAGLIPNSRTVAPCSLCRIILTGRWTVFCWPRSFDGVDRTFAF